VLLFVVVQVAQSGPFSKIAADERRLRRDIKRLSQSFRFPGKKKVLLVIDVQNGYDADFISTLSGKGGLAYLQQEHEINGFDKTSYFTRATRDRNVEKQLQQTLLSGLPGTSTGKFRTNYNKGWNLGMNLATVAARINAELTKAWDLVVFTTDYLDPDAIGVFVKGDNVGLVPYGEFLALTAGNTGTEVSSKIQINGAAPNCQRNYDSARIATTASSVFCFRKTEDDAFDSDPTHIDVTSAGKVRRDAQTLAAYLKKFGFGPDQAELFFSGIVTDRCVAKSLISACKGGYKTTLIEKAAMATSPADHGNGLQAIYAGCPTATIDTA